MQGMRAKEEDTRDKNIGDDANLINGRRRKKENKKRKRGDEERRGVKRGRGEESLIHID